MQGGAGEEDARGAGGERREFGASCDDGGRLAALACVWKAFNSSRALATIPGLILIFRACLLYRSGIVSLLLLIH